MFAFEPSSGRPIWSVELFELLGFTPAPAPPALRQLLKRLDSSDRAAAITLLRALRRGEIPEERVFSWRERTGAPLRLVVRPASRAGPSETGFPISGIVQVIGASGARPPETLTGVLDRHGREGVLVHRDLKPLHANAAAARYLGLGTPDDILAMASVAELFPADARAAMSTGETMFDVEILGSDGDPVLLECARHEVDWPGGPATLLLLRDVSRRRAAERAMAATEARLGDFAEAASDWLWETDADLRLRFVSLKRKGKDSGLARLLGLNPWELPGANVDDPAWQRHQSDIKARRQFRNFRFAYRDAKDRWRHGEVSGKPCFDEAGRFIGYRGAGRDITLRVLAEEKRDDQRLLLQTVLDAVPMIITLKDTGNRVVYHNRYAVDHYGLTGRDVIGKTPFDLFPEDFARAVVAHDREVIDSGDSRKFFEAELVLEDKVIQTLSNKIPLRNEAGETTGILTIAIDISDWKTALAELELSEKALRKQAAMLENTLENIDQGLLVLDARQRILLINQRARVLFALPEGAALPGKPLLDGLASEIGTNLHLIREASSELPDAGGEGDVTPGHTTSVLPGGTIVEVGVNQGADGGSVITITDITGRRALQEQVRQLQKMEAVGHLTGGIAHEFNNLLAVIVGNLELIEHDLTTSDNRASRMAKVFGAIERGAELTQRLLAFSRRQTLTPRNADTGMLLADMAEWIRRAVGPGVEVSVDCVPGIWPLRVDVDQLEQAVINIALNARDAMNGTGRFRIQAENTRLDQEFAESHADTRPGDYVCLTFSDTGRGMSHAVRDRAFDPFFTTKEVGQGTGLGLSMVYGFVKQSGGDVQIDSTPGEGTSFRLYLPRAWDRVFPGSGEDRMSGQPTARRKHVLVASDDREFGRSMADILDGLGYHVTAADSAANALHIAGDSETIDLLIADLHIRGTPDGPALAREIAAHQPGIAVIFISGRPDLDGGIDSHATVFLKRPLRAETVARAVRKALGERGI
ncbi:PAS domain-containing protein [Oceanibacterium hippocampi]|nr:PAS domain-containing protein [Oceanibacterium hippocampi]